MSKKSGSKRCASVSKRRMRKSSLEKLKEAGNLPPHLDRRVKPSSA